MTRTSKILSFALTVMFLMTLPACAKVGSKRWCEKMESKSVADWTPREAKDYAKHCVFD